MDDGDGAFTVEMLAGQSPDVILETIYNGSKTCVSCGTLITPTTAMYTGDKCPDCITKSAGKRVNEMIGR